MIELEFSLLLAALVLVAFEVILPGGILGVLAAVCVLISTGLVYADHGILAAAGMFLGSAVLIALLVYFEFKILSKTTLGKAFFLNESITGRSGSAQMTEIADRLIGASGKTLTRLNPSGKVDINGQSYEASSQDGYLDPDEPITVVSRDNFKLIIRKK